MTDKTRVIRVRLPNEVVDWIETGIYTRRVIEWLYGEVKGHRASVGEDGEIKFSSSHDKRAELLSKVPLEQLEDLDVMCRLSGGRLSDLLVDLQKKLDNCEIGLDKGKITLD